MRKLGLKFKSDEFGKVKEYQQPPIALTDTEIDLIRNFDLKRYYKDQTAIIEKQISKEKIEFKREFMLKGLKSKVASLELTRDRAYFKSVPD